MSVEAMTMEATMKLSELRGRGTPSQRESERGQHFEQLGVIRNSATYQRPIEALYQGQPVTLLATGDIVGMSPAVQIVDENGRIDWVSQDEVVVTQREFLPLSEQTRSRIQQSSRAGSYQS